MTERDPFAYEPNWLNRRLGKIGLVYGNSGLREFNTYHAGFGIPLYRRRTLEAAEAYGRAHQDLIASIKDTPAAPSPVAYESEDPIPAPMTYIGDDTDTSPDR